jgi:hypothetical protein
MSMARLGPCTCVVVAALACAAPAAARAETHLAEPDPTPQSAVLLPDTGLTIDLGAALRERPTHLGSNDYTIDLVPFLDGQWGKDLHFSFDDGIQYTALRWGRLKLGPDLEYRQPYNNDLAPRARRTSDAIEAGGFAKVDLTYGELDVRFRKALNGYEGYSGDVSLDTLIPVSGRQWFVGLEGRIGWADRKFALNAFGRSFQPGQAVTDTPTGDYYSAGAQAALIYLWRPRDKLILSFSDDQILRPTHAASGSNTRSAMAVFLVFAHRFSF